MSGYPIPTSLPVTPQPKDALVLPTRTPARPAWPGWSGVRVAGDHTHHAARSGPLDREAGDVS